MIEYIRDHRWSQNDLPADRSATVQRNSYYVTGGHCVVCGQAFDGWHRYNRSTCDDACRQKLHRAGSQLDSRFLRAMECVENIALAGGIERYRAGAISALRALQDAIAEALDDLPEDQS